MPNTILNILLIVLLILVGVLIALYFAGRKLQAKQNEQQIAIDAHKQTISMLVIDKKKLKIKDSGLPKIVYEQMPKYLRFTKLPIIKAKVGPKIMTLMADEKIFKTIPTKTEIKAVVSGIYITEIKSARGGLLAPEEKKGFFKKLLKK